MITMTEIAKLTGVSQATVSRVLNRNKSVNPEVAKKVMECAREHDFQPNIIARSLVGNKTFLIGLIVTDISNPFFAELVKAIENEAGKYGYNIMLFNSDYSKDKENKFLTLLKQYHADGVLLVPAIDTKEYIQERSRYELPLVSATMDLKKIDSVFISHFDAGVSVAKHLLSVGYESFIFVGGLDDEKENGFKSQLVENGIDMENHYLYINGKDDKDVMNQLKMQIEKECLDDGVGIFANNDVQAIKIMEMLKALNIKIPQDVALIGFDNIFLGKITNPTLTSVAQPIEELGKLSVERLLQLINGRGRNQEECARYQLETRVVIRESTVKAKKELTK